MSDALGQGWLVAIFVVLIPSVLVPFGKWVASRWRRPVEELKADKEKLAAALAGKNTELLEEQKLRMYYEISLDYCKSETRNLRATVNRLGGGE